MYNPYPNWTEGDNLERQNGDAWDVVAKRHCRTDAIAFRCSVDADYCNGVGPGIYRVVNDTRVKYEKVVLPTASEVQEVIQSQLNDFKNLGLAVNDPFVAKMLGQYAHALFVNKVKP